jgi:multiple sugar transport system permease protein
MRTRLRYNTQLRLFLIPYVVGSIILVIIPALATAAVAFTEYNSIQPPEYVGFENFIKLYQSQLARTSLRSTVIFLLITIPLRMIGALLLALLLQSKRRFFAFHRSAVYLPTVIPEVAYAIIWLWIFNPLYGPLNKMLAAVGITGLNWLAEPGTAQAAIIIMALFTIGEGFIVMLAGLQSIPLSYYESAKVDGASAWQSFWRITFPLILPWILLLSFRDLIVSLQATFTPTFTMTYGGPYYSTTYIPLLIYELAFDFFDFGMAAAALIMTYIVLVMLIAGVLNIVSGWGGSDA